MYISSQMYHYTPQLECSWGVHEQSKPVPLSPVRRILASEREKDKSGLEIVRQRAMKVEPFG